MHVKRKRIIATLHRGRVATWDFSAIPPRVVVNRVHPIFEFVAITRPNDPIPMRTGVVHFVQLGDSVRHPQAQSMVPIYLRINGQT